MQASHASYLHLRSLRWGNFSIIYLDLSSGHFVQTLMHDPQRLSHFLDTAQISKAQFWQKGCVSTSIILI